MPQPIHTPGPAGPGRLRRPAGALSAAGLIAASLLSSCGEDDMIARASKMRPTMELPYGKVNPFYGAGEALPRQSSNRIPGELLGDLLTAVEEGTGSGLILLETGKEEDAFNLWASKLLARGSLDGLTLLRMEDQGEVRVYEAAMPEMGYRFLLRMQLVDDRWRIVGVKRLA